jgi:predicted enzyme related to lactoylglutathione lyase
MPEHAIVHIEIASSTPAETAKFYGELFNWKLTHDEQFDYWMFDSGTRQGGGFVKPDGQTYKIGDVVVYISTDDIDASLAQVQALGGKVTTPKTEIPGMGWFAHFTDPAGNRLALFQYPTKGAG